ncbi:Rtt102p LALA0_S10e00562g [Lachancea lanzarotensis]|uniref:LALA0S10e00562g1_1 n=1 Tax=Lachancea lanzarotensis TaxID=1245769 RepID=A0A0C7NCH2_9SACH|nr:uncharacterized protein LALA0_S10e00562g [Lachancea lanzarotensis]CEP64027.1 LALA0S10e00562g1_1 [Lachancea lanzarotensis]
MEANALISRANNASTYNFGNSNCKFWKFDWHTPVKPRPSGSAPAEKSDGNDNNDEELYNFKYKTWLASENAAWDVLSANPNETIDLSLFDRTQQVGQTTKQSNHNNNGPSINGQNTADNGLSADDIRGAVGGQESLPGFTTQEEPEDRVREQSAVVGKTTEISDSPAQTNASNSGEDIPESKIGEADGDIKLD